MPSTETIVELKHEPKGHTQWIGLITETIFNDRIIPDIQIHSPWVKEVSASNHCE